MKSDLNLLFEQASSETAPFHEKNLPSKQRLPLPVRRTLQLLILPFIHLDLFMQKVARQIIRLPYKRAGQCKRRGNCCRNILIEPPRNIFGRIYYWWQTEINGFFPRNKKDYEHDGTPIWVMGCRHLAPNGQCQQYRYRPLVCRKWPEIECFGKPRLLKGCGYKIEKRNKN